MGGREGLLLQEPHDFAFLGKSSGLVFRKDQLSIDGDVEDAATAGGEGRGGVKGGLQFRC